MPNKDHIKLDEKGWDAYYAQKDSISALNASIAQLTAIEPGHVDEQLSFISWDSRQANVLQMLSDVQRTAQSFAQVLRDAR